MDRAINWVVGLMKQQQFVQNNQFKKLIFKQLSIAILCMGISVLFFSCANKIEKIKEFSANAELPTIEADSFEMIYSDSAIIRFKLKTKRLIEYDQEKDPFTEFPEGIELVKYDINMQVVSKITADYARNYENEKKWVAKNNVTAVNQQGDTLKTEELTWEEETGRLYSDKYVKIIGKDEIITGTGFESNQDMTDWQIKNIRNSTVYLNVKE